MYHSNRFKTLWWFLIVLDLSYFLTIRLSSYISGSATLFDAVVFLAWISMCMIPVFFDVGIFDFKSEAKQAQDLNRELSAHGT